MLWLAVSPMTVAATAQVADVTPETAETVAGDFDVLRRLYIMQPDFVPSYLAQISTEDHPALPARYRPPHVSEALLDELDRICLDATGVPLLQDNIYAMQLLDSLRLAFYSNPKVVPDDRIEHLESVSRRVSGRSFVQASPVLIHRLKQDRADYFARPAAYEKSRLEDLDLISLRVTSLPFLRGSPDLAARIERARIEYDESDANFSAERLRQLDSLSVQIIGEPFLRKRSQATAWIFLVAGLSVLVLVAAYGFARVRPRLRPSEPTEQSNENETMTIVQACRILSVEPDADTAEIARAYRQQQKRYHPDVVAHLGEDFLVIAERRTREINRAYDILCTRNDNAPAPVSKSEEDN